MSSTAKRPRTALTAGVALAVSSALLAPAGVSHAEESSLPAGTTPPTSPHLNLGPADLPETRTVSTLAPGVTLTRIKRGGEDSSLYWTAEVAIPSDSPDPDAPSSALSSQADAQKVADKLEAAGIAARVEQVSSPQLADAGGNLGYRVRAGHFAAKADGDSTVAAIKAAGYSSSVLYTGWDGDPATSGKTRGPWTFDVVTIDPKKYHGRLAGSYGSDLEKPETVSQLSAASNAVAAINGGFFVFDPKAGAPGDRAGAGVYNGKTLSEPVGDRPALVLDSNTNKTSIDRLRWGGTLSARHATVALDGIDRVPGLIRNCGETNDQPTSSPLQDITCTNPNELVAFTPQFGRQTPSGPGLEVTTDRNDTVTGVADARGTAVPAGGHTVQATGSDVARLRALARVGAKLKVRATLLAGSRQLNPTEGTSILNGGPMLVRNGAEDVTVRQDGMVHANDNNSFYYGWVHKRNPRTFAGVDAQGRTLLVTADGRQTSALGLSLKEEADVARSLGMVQAMNLDGGGSTTTVASGQLMNVPSGGAERPVGDALLVLPEGR